MSSSPAGSRGTVGPISPPEDPRSRSDELEARPRLGLSLVDILVILLRHRRMLLILPIATAGLWVVVSLLLPRTFTSSAAFTPSSSTQSMSQLAGLASQFGFSLPTSQSSESPEFYATLLGSEHLLRAAAETKYAVAQGQDTVRRDLVGWFHAGGSTPARKVESAVDELRKRLSVSTDDATGLVRLGVKTHDAMLSRSVAQRLVDLVNAFNLETRQTQAAAERQFLDTRVTAARGSLRSVEDSLEQFLEHNRSYESSPELTFQYNRLQSHVTLQQQVYSTLVQSYEQAKIEAVRNTPVITVVEPPDYPVRPDRRYLLLKVVLGLIGGGVLALFVSAVLEWTRRARRDEPAEFAHLERLLGESRNDVRRWWFRLRRILGRVRRGRHGENTEGT